MTVSEPGESSTMDDLVGIWRKVIVGEEKSWVLFENGTVVISTKPEADLAKYAVDLMERFAGVHPGSPAGDFSVIDLNDREGWVVTCHHPDILNYVSTSEVGDGASDVTIGLLGRSNRDADARDLKVAHVEDNRPVT